MAEVEVDQRRLLKTLRWYDGFVIGLANPGFLLVGLAFSIACAGRGSRGDPLGRLWPASARSQAYVYAEPAAMFPDKPGGLSVYAREGWRKYFSLAGSDRGLRLLVRVVERARRLRRVHRPADLQGVLRADADPLIASLGIPVSPTSPGPRVMGLLCILACYLFNIRGMRPAVWFSYVVGALMLLPVAVIAIGPFLTGDFNNHAVRASTSSDGHARRSTASGPQVRRQFMLIMAWLYMIGWSTLRTRRQQRRSRRSSRTRRTTLARPGGQRPVERRARCSCCRSRSSEPSAYDAISRRPHRRRLPGRRDARDRRRRLRRRCSRSACAVACCSR